MFHGIEGLFFKADFCCQLSFAFNWIRNIYIPALFPHEATTEDENSRIPIPKINMMMSKAE